MVLEKKNKGCDWFSGKAINLSFNTWSVDKIKVLITNIKEYQIQELMDYLAKGSSTNVVSWESNKITTCKFNYNYAVENYGEVATLFIGVNPNFIVNAIDKKMAIMLEYNPNKININMIQCLMFLIHYDKINFKIMKVDLAYDMDKNINEFTFVKRHALEYFCDIGHNSLETKYFGDKVNNFAPVKIYDKRVEQGIKIENFEWTRYEITLKLGVDFTTFLDYNYVNIFSFNFENIKIFEKGEKDLKEMEKSNVSSVDLILVKACLEHRDWLKELNKDKRRKIQGYIDLVEKSNESEIELDKREMYKTLKDYIQSMFMLGC